MTGSLIHRISLVAFIATIWLTAFTAMAGVTKSDGASKGPIILAQTAPWKGTQSDYAERCRQTNLPGKRFYTERNDAGQRGYCCTTPDKKQGWCCWDRGGGRFDCGAR